MRQFLISLTFAVFFIPVIHADVSAQVVINEIHYHPDINTEPVEFIELHNPSAGPVDISGWYFSGITYVFPAGSTIAAGGYVIVSENQKELLIKFHKTSFGPFEGKLSNEGEHIVLYNAAGETIDEVDYGSDFPWPISANGEGASMELLNPSLDNDLSGSWRSSGYNENVNRPESAFGTPTPGARNSVYTTNVPPQIRQVNHEPKQPLSNQQTVITAKVTDSDGVKDVVLKYQVVLPGSYIPAYLPVTPISSLISNPSQSQRINPNFENPANWSQLEMVDDGTGRDAVAGDDIYTAVIPGQINRTLMRYRIEAEDNSGEIIRVPYADDPSLNFAYYVYDGVPDYVAGRDSVHPDGPGHVYSSEILTSLPVYTLITRAQDFYQCNGYSPSDRIGQSSTNLNYQYAGRVYNWEGAFVYEGKVYDHIGYRLRGGNGRYNYAEQGFNNAGKRSMKFRFNRGNYFQARDLFGDKFPSKWQHLNTGKMYGNQLAWGNYRRYPYGLNEVMDMLLFEAADVPAYKTWWIHFRVVDGAEEAPTGTNGQYEGDFWGLHLALENYDGAFLERLDLPEGNLYKLSDKIYGGLDQLRYQGEFAVDDASDYENIRWNLTYEASADFIRNHLDCDEWYRYHTVIESIRSFDVFTGASCFHCMKNLAWYFYPDYTAGNNYFGKVQFLPFDVDDSWGPYFNYGIDHAKGAIYDQSYIDHAFTQYPIDPEKSPLKQEYRNYIREFRDLHWQPEVIDGMLAQLVAFIEDFVPADRDRWRLDPIPGSPIDNGSLEENVELLEQFAWSAGSFRGGFYWPGTSNNLDALAGEEGDSTNIPNTPTISYMGAPDYPINDLRFRTSLFSDAQGTGTFDAMKWRIAEYDLNYSPEPSGTSDEIVLLKKNSYWRYFKGTAEPSNPIEAWRQADFDDNNWLLGQTSIGYADNDDNTVLDDMYQNYYTVYLRNTFEMTDKNKLKTLKLNVYVDDGCIIYINGTEVKRMYCGDGDKLHDSLTGVSDHEAAGYEQVTLMGPYYYLVDGTNVIAVHALQTATSSSDFSIDVSVALIASSEPVEPAVVPPLGKSKYELHPIWESDEITNLVDRNIQIPGGVVEVGKTYRVRSRTKDDTGRWSHWSSPIEFVAGKATGADILDYLRISELMYNPAENPAEIYENEEFEFIELKNISNSVTLDLSTVSITDGVEFAFAGSNVVSLGPGEFVLIVRNQAAFETRYGTGFSDRIAGTYSGRFDNGGERVGISDEWNGPVISFTYSDDIGWPQAADGQGYSLVPKNWGTTEDLQAGILDDPDNWLASANVNGSPGAEDPGI
ncbi:MAG: lamin tail domain-containing protein [Sedimentisphaerales bacterium]|nr:lamin tail domain-containing protein [Sedimentisphaerales bacterium]